MARPEGVATARGRCFLAQRVEYVSARVYTNVAMAAEYQVLQPQVIKDNVEVLQSRLKKNEASLP